MTFSKDVLRFDERAVMSLRSLYRQYGYAQYRMSKFEEYELYARNMSFLASESIITFTDVRGRLMALRPDVTLSIVKNLADDGGTRKLYYNENVYRPGGFGHEFKERVQAGLECIGEVDVYSMCEVVMLAELSLRTISDNYCLDISHMGFLSGLLESAAPDDALRGELLRRISEKNVPELMRICTENKLPTGFCEKITTLAALYGPYDETIATLRAISPNAETDAALGELEQIYNTLDQLGATKHLRLDFSLVNDMSYYSGVIFQGFIDGVPMAVLSGGRYDKLLEKFGKTSGAIGFAVYLDLLERIDPPRRFDVDILLLYDADTDTGEVAHAMKRLTVEGYSVKAQRGEPGAVKYGRLMRVVDGEAQDVK